MHTRRFCRKPNRPTCDVTYAVGLVDQRYGTSDLAPKTAIATKTHTYDQYAWNADNP